MSFPSRFFVIALLLAPLVGCGGGGSSSRSAVPVPTSTVAPTATSTATPTATPLPRLSAPIPLIEGRRIGEDFFAAPNNSGQTVGADSCDTSHYDYHIHSHLSIFLDGRQLAVPAAVGFKNPRFVTTTQFPDGFVAYGDCVYGLHTHDTSGKLHVEGEVKRTFTLGEVFGIWGVPLSYENFAGITGRPVVVYLNDSTNTGGGAGKSNLRVYSGDLASLELESKREITVQIGSRIASVPTYIWYGENDQSGHHDALSAARVRAMKK